MLGYISSTRKKSCFACVKSKRRCDLGFPYCKRCFVKGLDCTYPNATPRDTNNQRSGAAVGEVVLRQTTPDISLPVTSGDPISSTEFTFVDANITDFNIDPFLGISSSSSGSSSSPEQLPQDLLFQDDWRVEPRVEPRVKNDWSVEVPQLLPTSMFVAPNVEPQAYLNRDQVSYVIAGLLAFPASMAYAGSTFFIHRNLYDAHEPSAYQDCVALSALYMTKTARNRGILSNSIGQKVSGLISQSATWTLIEHLAAVQALIVYQVIRLFDPDLNLQTAAQKDNAYLELWSAHLWKRSFNEPQSFPTPHARYAFQESLRRTVLMSVFVRCGWSTLTKGGLAEQVPILRRLPLAKNLGAWKCEPEAWLLEDEEELMLYGDWSTSYIVSGRTIEELDPFGRLLIGACKGKEDPRLLVDEIACAET
jgi:hypothetical protein